MEVKFIDNITQEEEYFEIIIINGNKENVDIKTLMRVIKFTLEEAEKRCEGSYDVFIDVQEIEDKMDFYYKVLEKLGIYVKFEKIEKEDFVEL